MRTQARIAVFNLIYINFFEQIDLDNQESENKFKEIFSYLTDLENLTENDKEFAKELFIAFCKNKDNIKNIIENSIVNYEIDRIYKTDLALLYMGVTEIVYLNTPKPIVIDEILKIAKQYSTEKSASFINGVLAKITF